MICEMGEKDLPPNPKYYHGMGIKELVKYCDSHPGTPRALFSRDMIAQMIDYAGNPQGYPSAKEMANGNIKWPLSPEEIKTLVNLCNKKYDL
ncbi:unnamed protein product [marine sediment metagenome]|uniref:Uncharacterized protein n=1 Tax=marine sediment metagenome TaxID=412755 RepID=X1QYK8_9ZZZZ